MSGFDERLTWLLTGILIGYILSKIQDIRRDELEIKRKLEEVDSHVMQKLEKNDAGFMRFPVFADLMVLILVCVTLYAAVMSQKNSNEVSKTVSRVDDVTVVLENTQRELKAVTSCNTVYQKRTIKALNERTQYSADQALSNVKLQTAQAAFLQIALIVPPVTAEALRSALQKYYDRLGSFVDISKKNRDQVLKYEYPSDKDLSTCIDIAVEQAKKQAEKEEKEKND